MPKRRGDLVLLGRWHAGLGEVNAPLTYHPPDLVDQFTGGRQRQRESFVRGKCVVERRQPALGADAQMQEAFAGVAGARQYVVKRAEASAGQARAPQEAVVAEVVIVIAHEDVEDHALEQLDGVLADDRGVAVAAHGFREVGVRLGA